MNKLTGLFLLVFSSMLVSSSVNANTQWQVHGFIAQGAIDVNGSDFVNDDGDLSFELTEIGINSSYQYSSDIRFTAQAVYLNGGNRYNEGARIDYALIDWSIYNDTNWLVNLYIGRYKSNNWLYSSTRDVPHTRPTIILPQSLYFDGFRDIAMGSEGAGIKINFNAEKFGDFDFYFNYGSSSLSSDEVKLLLGDVVQGTGKKKFDAQTSIYWQPEYSQWRFGFSLLDSDFNYHRAGSDFVSDALFSFQQFTINASYEGEYWEFSSEIFQQDFTLDGFFFNEFHQNSIGQGVFLQSKYKFNNKFTLLARIEKFYADKNDKKGELLEINSGGLVPSYFGFQNDMTLGLSYYFDEKLRLQMEYHQVTGTSRLTPIVFPNTTLNDSKKWNMFAIQLMYWF